MKYNFQSFVIYDLKGIKWININLNIRKIERSVLLEETKKISIIVIYYVQSSRHLVVPVPHLVPHLTPHLVQQPKNV